MSIIFYFYLFSCEQTKANGIIEQLSLSVCLEAGFRPPDPPESEPCVITGTKLKNRNIDSCDSADDFEYRPVLEWSECTKSCHEGRRYRRVSCYKISTNRAVLSTVCQYFNIQDIPEVES